MTRLGKRIMHSGVLRMAAAYTASLYIRTVFATSRFDVRGHETLLALLARGEGFIICFWHGRMMMLPRLWTWLAPGDTFQMLISNRRDGRFIARIAKTLGIQAIAGSSSRGGREALQAGFRALESGECLGMTPDGPRGPGMRASPGVVIIARSAGVPILPVSYSTTRRWLFNSWDKFQLALPFGRIQFDIGEPIRVPRETGKPGIEIFRSRVEQALNKLNNDSDRACGWSPDGSRNYARSGRERSVPEEKD